MSAGSDASDRTYDPTPRRREQFRKDGRFPRARDAGGMAAALAVLGALTLVDRSARGAWHELLIQAFGRADQPELALVRALELAGTALAIVLVPVLFAAGLAAFGAGAAQAGLHVETESIGFKFERLNPLPRLMEIFAPKRGAVETVLALLRIGLVGYVAYRAVLIELPVLLGLSRLALADGVATLVRAASRVVLTATGALAVVTAADYGWSFWRHEQDLKMTRQELMDEARAEDGDPKAKARMRARARAAAKKRALSQVKNADVIVTNPTHIAVALRYGGSDAAPVVIAKGHDEVALAIRREARKHGIPIVENRPLARALDANVAVGKIIPASHFIAVAKILAFVYQIKNRRR